MVPWLPVSPLEGLRFDFTPQQAEEVPHWAGITVAAAALACGLRRTLLPQPQHDGPPLTATAKESLRFDQRGDAGTKQAVHEDRLKPRLSILYRHTLSKSVAQP